jgi:hypothetical protein
MKQATTSDLKSGSSNGTRVTDNASKQKNTVIREVYWCLVPCSQCTGTYVDSINGNMLRIICRHNCHSSGQLITTDHNRKKQPQEHLSVKEDIIIPGQEQGARSALLWSKMATRPESSGCSYTSRCEKGELMQYGR